MKHKCSALLDREGHWFKLEEDEVVDIRIETQPFWNVPCYAVEKKNGTIILVHNPAKAILVPEEKDEREEV